jgi:hypothetical protein
MPKEAGRHAFVTRNLGEGKSLKWMQDSGRWKTLKIKIVAEKYGHLEKQEVDRQARQAGEEWFRKVLTERPQIEGTRANLRGFGIASSCSQVGTFVGFFGDFLAGGTVDAFQTKGGGGVR